MRPFSFHAGIFGSMLQWKEEPKINQPPSFVGPRTRQLEELNPHWFTGLPSNYVKEKWRTPRKSCSLDWEFSCRKKRVAFFAFISVFLILKLVFVGLLTNSKCVRRRLRIIHSRNDRWEKTPPPDTNILLCFGRFSSRWGERKTHCLWLKFFVYWKSDFNAKRPPWWHLNACRSRV